MGLKNSIDQRKGFKQLMAKLYGFGAAIVIVAPSLKIQLGRCRYHAYWQGLFTEAVIFFSAFEPPHEEVDGH